jgi:hypothetical protein
MARPQKSDYPQGDSNHPRKTREKCPSGKSTTRRTTRFSADLEKIIDRWPALSEPVQQAILDLVDRVE